MYKYKLVRFEIEGFKKFQKKFILDLKSPSGDPINYFCNFRRERAWKDYYT